MTDLGVENSDLRQQLRTQSGEPPSRSSQHVNQELAYMGNIHRGQIETLSKMNADLRTDLQRRDEHLMELRLGSQTANGRIVGLLREINEVNGN